MQVHLLGSIYLGPFWLIIMGLICLILFVNLALGFLWLIVSIIKKKGKSKPIVMAISSICLFFCFTLSVDWAEKLIVSQREYNDNKGAIIVKAVQKFKEREGRYPYELRELRINDIPRYKHGFIKREFIYWNEKNKPNLKYCSGLLTGRFFNFNDKIWWSSTL